jgi:hypothetical protein
MQGLHNMSYSEPIRAAQPTNGVAMPAALQRTQRVCHQDLPDYHAIRFVRAITLPRR